MSEGIGTGCGLKSQRNNHVIFESKNKSTKSTQYQKGSIFNPRSKIDSAELVAGQNPKSEDLAER
jgi:hypothetical protein